MPVDGAARRRAGHPQGGLRPSAAAAPAQHRAGLGTPQQSSATDNCELKGIGSVGGTE